METSTPPPTPTAVLDPKDILGPEGPVADKLSNYEPRPPQIKMAEAIKVSMGKFTHLFCEAGTGTGKSYAFLIPAIEKALNGGGPVVISTNTISLQEQIFNKDIPDLKKYLGLPQLRVVLRKGRGNYLSKRRLKIAGNFIEADQINEYDDISDWVDKSLTGAKQDLDFIPIYDLWDAVRSDQYDCLGKKCPTYKECFYFKSKAQAEEAHIVITNHSLLALDLMLKHKTDDLIGILPKFKHLIIDEAHTFEDALRKADTFEWKQGSAAAIMRRATNKKGRGFLDTLLKINDVPYKCASRAKEVIKSLKKFVELNALFFEKDIVPFIQTYRKKLTSPTAKRVKPGNLVSTYSENLLATLRGINQYLSSIVSELKRLDGEDVSKEIKNLATLLEAFLSHLRETGSDLKRAIEADKDTNDTYPTYVSSVEMSGLVNNKNYYTLMSIPIFVRQTGQKVLFNKEWSLVLTSATLTTNNSFKSIIRNLGAITERTTTLQLPHVFDYQKQVKLHLTPNTPDDPWSKRDKREAYFDTIAKLVENYVAKTKGNAFILCTSNLQMRALHKRSKLKLERKGMYVLCQNNGLTRDQMINEFKTVENSVLYGVDSFWTGVDVPGKHLQCIIIPKLPFSPPTPLSEAQQDMYKLWNYGKPRHKQRNYFADRTIPQVAVRLQQGFGRLIRRKNDTGIVVILDQRMRNKPYGHLLLRSLPECPVIIDD